jgi:hypothetical protein
MTELSSTADEFVTTTLTRGARARVRLFTDVVRPGAGTIYDNLITQMGVVDNVPKHCLSRRRATDVAQTHEANAYHWSGQLPVYLENLDFKVTHWSLYRNNVAYALIQQSPTQRRLKTQPSLTWVGFIGSYQVVTALFAVLVLHCHPCAKANLVTAYRSRLDNDRALEPLGKKTHTAIDLAQLAFAVNVFSIFRTITLGRGFGHFMNHTRPFDSHQFIELGRELFGAIRGEVVGH